MTILGFDTSMPVTAACILRDDGRAFATEPPDAARLAGPPEHSAELLPAIARLLEESGTGWRELDSIAVGVGPGTFTGLRIGVATARGLGQALDLPLRPVPSLLALAAGLAATQPAGASRPLLPLIDARRDQVFAALYRLGVDAESDLALEWGPDALEPTALIERVADLDPPPLAAGDWALESRSDLESAGVEVPSSDSGLHAVDAFQVCRLAGKVEPVQPDQVRPIYVRLPDAEINKRSGTGT